MKNLFAFFIIIPMIININNTQNVNKAVKIPNDVMVENLLPQHNGFTELLYNENELNNLIEELEITEYSVLIDSLSIEEKELIYKITHQEAGNQDIEGQRAVIEVILNRVLHDAFPNSVKEVLSAPSQFSTWAIKDRTSQANMDKISEVLSSMEETPNDSVFIKYIEENGYNVNPQDYVYFARDQQKYGHNYIKIGDHWFGTR